MEYDFDEFIEELKEIVKDEEIFAFGFINLQDIKEVNNGKD